MFFSLLKRGRNTHSSCRPATLHRSRAARLQVETLEERLTPATRVWAGGGTDILCGGLGTASNWTCPANWVGDVAPRPGVDILEFPAVAARKANTNDFAGA